MIIKSNSDEDIIIYFHKIFYPGDIYKISETDFFTLNDPNILYRYFSTLSVEQEYLFLFNNNNDIDLTFDNIQLIFERKVECILNGNDQFIESIYLTKKDIIIFSAEESFKVKYV